MLKSDTKTLLRKMIMAFMKKEEAEKAARVGISIFILYSSYIISRNVPCK
jgi:hypothetical protein